jgi:hypothetical protein
MIPGVGPYSALITPKAGSLFHAVFQPMSTKAARRAFIRKQKPPSESAVSRQAPGGALIQEPAARPA